MQRGKGGEGNFEEGARSIRMSPRTEKGSAPPPRPEHLGELGIVVHSLHDAVTSGTLLEWRQPWIVLICSQAVQMICALPQLILARPRGIETTLG
jgi:hypothetical protein